MGRRDPDSGCLIRVETGDSMARITDIRWISASEFSWATAKVSNAAHNGRSGRRDSGVATTGNSRTRWTALPAASSNKRCTAGARRNGEAAWNRNPRCLRQSSTCSAEDRAKTFTTIFWRSATSGGAGTKVFTTSHTAVVESPRLIARLFAGCRSRLYLVGIGDGRSEQSC